MSKIFFTSHLFFFVQDLGTEISSPEEEDSDNGTQTYDDPYPMKCVLSLEERGAEKVADSNKRSGPYGFTDYIYANKRHKRHTREPGGKEYHDRETETVGYLGNEEDGILVLGKQILDFGNIRLLEAKVFPESVHERMTYPVPYEVPYDIPDDIPDDNREQKRKKTKKSDREQHPAKRCKEWTFRKRYQNNDQVHQVRVRNRECFDNGKHGTKIYENMTPYTTQDRPKCKI